jgi:hypothetical protein
MATEKLNFFIAKQNLPGGIIKGQLVVAHSVAAMNSKIVAKHRITQLQYDPATEPEFFTAVPSVSKYVTGELVYIEPEFARDNSLSINTQWEITAVSFYKGAYRYSIKNVTNSQTVVTTESKLIQPKVYWFVSSSSGSVQSMPLTKDHMDSFAYKFRSANRNVFSNKADAQSFLNKILNS